ncbi:hypothetical protein WG66_006227 [Moniliophthora roreri]|uniref:Uncharacterized protein n=1 Tax=Moniliophthora roreri TaxID=221103 RepID=A0A0W0G911_MONRR|nr:hypothetical protein WG66_006227 [Moniliophthora roreri]
MSGSVFLNEKNIMSYSVRPTVFRFLRSLKPPDPNPELEEAKTVFKSVTKRPIDIAVIRYALSWFSRPSEAAQTPNGAILAPPPPPPHPPQTA